MTAGSFRRAAAALCLAVIIGAVGLSYCQRREEGGMTPAPAPAPLSGPMCRAGVASQYSPGVMERVVANRQAGRARIRLPKTLPAVDGFVAAERCSDIGQVWTIRYRERVERFLVADCSGSAATTRWMRRNNILVEIDHQTARRWGVVGRGARVEVCRPERWPD